MNTEVYFIRHGEPMLQKALLGSTDSPLSQYGWQQLQTSFVSLCKVEQLISSPLSRCASFAQQFSVENQLPLDILEEWKECDFGEWDGEAYQTLYQKFPDLVEKYFNEPGKYTPPGGEALDKFCLRVEQALNHLLEKYQGKRLAVITHAGVIRTLIAWCLKMNYSEGLQFRRFALDYASITHFSFYHGEKIFPQIISLNQSSHLASIEVQKDNNCQLNHVSGVKV